MRVLVQRVLRAQVDSNGETLAAIGQGLLVFLGITKTDAREEADWPVKLQKIRFFANSLQRDELVLSYLVTLRWRE